MHHLVTYLNLVGVLLHEGTACEPKLRKGGIVRLVVVTVSVAANSEDPYSDKRRFDQEF